jgi:general secretion pathway protein M
MRAKLRQAWESRAPQERAIVAVAGLVLGALLYLWLLQAAERSREQLRTSVATLRGQAARLASQADEFERLRSAPVATVSTTDLLSLVQARVGDAGLARALVRIDARDADQVVTVFGAVVFADWLAWVVSLQTQQIRLDACRIEILSTPGLVSVTATLARAKRQ